MGTTRKRKTEASDRSMDEVSEDRSRVFFFPKRNPPISVRAASHEEAERQLAERDANLPEAPNRKEV